MKEKFPEYYPPTEDKYEEFFEDGLIVFDTNILLSLYEYSEETRKKLLKLMEAFSDHIWIPYRVAYEYQEQRMNVIYGQKKAYKNIKKKINSCVENIKNEVEEEKFEEILNKLSKIADKIEDKKEERPKWEKEDNIRDRLDELFEGNVGPSYSEDELEKIEDEGKERYENDMPPGFEDREKEENKFGDLVIWKQMIDKAEETESPILFVTNDSKTDWWEKVNENKIGPKYELIREMLDEAGNRFHMYTMKSFLRYGKEHVDFDLESAIEEVEQSEKENKEDSEELPTAKYASSRIPIKRDKLKHELQKTKKDLNELNEKIHNLRQKIEQTDGVRELHHRYDLKELLDDRNKKEEKYEEIKTELNHWNELIEALSP